MKIKVKDVAKMLGVTEQCIRIGLQRNKFDFGTAYKNGSRYKYIIYPEKLRAAVGSVLDSYYDKNTDSIV